MSEWAAIVVAAGQGRRFGRPKQLVDLAGRSVVAWSLAVFAGIPEIGEIVVVVESSMQAPMNILLETSLGKHRSIVVVGGDTRQASVRAGLAAVSSTIDKVLVHDGARPLVRPEDVRRGMRVVEPGRAAVLATPVVDTIKHVDERGQVTRTLDRSSLWAAQTPQFAMLKDLQKAHMEAERFAVVATDDTALLERSGVAVIVVPGYADNFKITSPGDLARAEAILRHREPTLPSEEEVLMLEAFVPATVVDTLLMEIENCDGDVDGIDRDLPQSVAVRAYLPSSRLERFRQRFELIAGTDATFTTRFSHGTARL